MRVLALSSGTSVDAIDVALADLSDAEGVVHVHLLGHAERPWPADLRAGILAVLPPAKISMGEVCALDTVIGQTFGDVGAWAIGQWGAVDLVVSHGQTVFHWVEGDTARGTLQIGAAAWIAERTGRPGARSALVLGSLTPPAPAPCPPATTPVKSVVVSSEKRSM
jgi:anhydro-N-acetylmuramic acid kinase